MPEIYVARRKGRSGLWLPREGTRKKPNLIFFLSPKMSKSQLDELIRKQLEQQGITEESEVQALIEKAEKLYEIKCKTVEAQRELKRLMELKAQGENKKMMQVGHRKWKETFYPAIIKEKKDG